MVLWTKFALLANLLNSSFVSDIERPQISHSNGSVKVLNVGSPPFVVQKGFKRYDGIDVQIIKTIAKKLGLNYTIYQRNQSTHDLK